MQQDLVDNRNEETEKNNAFTALHATKTRDQSLLEATLVKKNKENGDDTKQLTEDEQERSETQEQLKTDDAFFETTKESCKAKADQWAERTRLRTEELAGIGQAIDILTSDEAKAIFNSADTTFVQLSVTQKKHTAEEAYGFLKATASKVHSVKLAMIAAKLATGGHFDAVMKDIDMMVQALRDEETADVQHKDWCEKERSNANSKNEALEYDMGELNAAIGQTETEMGDLQNSMDTALNNRNTENA